MTVCHLTHTRSAITRRRRLLTIFLTVQRRRIVPIERFFQGFRLPGVSEDVATPHPTQRRHFVVRAQIGMWNAAR
jgi:hypothetical protein